jgi:PHD/YefM family antitoxin component YafN of YafNO toxin-antitoxin module
MVVLTQRGRQAVLEGLAVFEELREELEAETGGGTMEALLDGLEKVSRGLDALVARDRDAPR